MKYILYLFPFLLLSSQLLAQEEGMEEIDEACVVPTEKKWAKLYEKGTDKKKYDYKQRITALKELLEDKEDCAPCMWAIAKETFSRAKINGSSYDIPRKYYLQLAQTCPDYHADIYYNLGLIYYSEQDDCNALTYFKKFLDFKTQDEDKLSRKYDQQLKDVKEVLDEAEFYCDFFTTNKVSFNPVLVKNVSTADKDEYLPIISPDNELLFYTREYDYKAQGDIMSKKIQEFTQSYRNDASDNFPSGSALPKPFNIGPKYGGASISLDNKEMYICACAREAEYWNCDIFVTRYDIQEVEGQKKYIWSTLINVGENINGDLTWEAQPSLSADGNTLYFASSRPGGYGKIDLYYSERGPEGGWGPAQSMGPIINTSGSDKSPFMHSDSKTLYFVSELSDERYGAGGFDIFFSRQENGQWSVPQNIGFPINSEGDEEALIVSTDGNYGYFSSDHTKGGVGKKDLFYFLMPENARPDKVVLMKGKIESENIEKIKDAKLEVRYANGEVTEQKIKIQDNGDFVAVANIGDGKEDVLLEIKKEGKAYESTLIKADETEKTFFKDKELELTDVKKGSVHTINDILFSSNSSEIENASKLVLQGFVQWLKENPKISIEVQGHTDDIGRDKENLILSEERAVVIKQYLMDQGISPDRLSSKGYGKSRPKVENNSETNRAKNRRTDFKIL